MLKPIADDILEQYAPCPVFAPVSTDVPPLDLSHHAIGKLGVTRTSRGVCP